MSLYLSRVASLKSLISKLEKRIGALSNSSSKFSTCRLIVFVAGLILSVLTFIFLGAMGWISLVLFMLAFSIVVHLHNKLIWEINRFVRYKKIKEEHLARMNIDWDKIPVPLVNDPPGDLTMEMDLDLTGKHSLHNLIDTAVSREGSLMLRRLLTQYLPRKEEIALRQIIIKELTEMDSFRDKFLLRARLISSKPLECEKISNEIKSHNEVDLPRWILPVSFLLIVTYISLFVMNSFDMINSIWIIFFLVYFFIYSSFQKKLSRIVENSVEFENQIRKVSIITDYIEKFSFDNRPALKVFLKEFSLENSSPSLQLKKLHRNVSFLLARENPIIRLILNIIFPYDIFFCGEVQRCKSVIASHIDSWLLKLNELECSISLANYAYLNPDYEFPVLETVKKNFFEVKSLGHPLIKRDSKVCNDFSLEKENEIVIMTGSNMSGKSTFLKTIGINFSLANSGAPVNASLFKTSLFELFTCIKVTDSVIDGISYFYAEVRRLKELLDEFEVNSEVPKFFLIDEIFKGTNNKERLIGSEAYIKKLFELKGTGLISTHDLELVRLESVIPVIANYHFREEIADGKMIFDYKLHKGPCPTTNALRIMEMSGLPV